MITLNPVQLAIIVCGTFYFGRKYGRLEAIALTRPIRFQPEQRETPAEEE